MIQWLKNRLWNRRRLIFRYHDGTRVTAADPVEVAIALHSHPIFLWRHIGEAVEGNAESQRIVSDAACDVFGVSPLTTGGKGGLTIGERIELVMAFDLYLTALKKNTRVSVISLPSTESIPPTSSDPITKSM